MKKYSSFLAGALLLTLSAGAFAQPSLPAAAVNELFSPQLLAKYTIDPEIAKLEKEFKANPKDINRQTAYSTAVTQAMQKMQSQGMSNDAISLGERAAALIPHNASLMHLLGTCYLDRFCFAQDLQDYERAKKAWQKLIEAYPNSPDATLLWGLKCYENANYAAALQHFQRAFNARQSDPYTLAFVGMTLAKLNNHKQAAQGLGMAYNKLKANPAFLATQAAELRAIGQIDTANQRLAEANKYKHPQKPLRTMMELFPSQATPAATTAPATGTAPATTATSAKTATPATSASPTGTVPASTAPATVATPAKTAVPATGTAPATTATSVKTATPANPAASTPTTANVGSKPAAGSQTKSGSPKAVSNSPLPYRGLQPFPGLTPKPLDEVVMVDMKTDAGDIVIEVYPQAAPNAAKRFVELVKSGFYDNTPIFRVVRDPKPFVAQFGINWRSQHKEWKQRLFDDDPSLFQLAPATLAFAKAGKNINSTQVFINYGDNNFLRGQGFTTFARIVSGYDIAKNFRSVGSASMGLDQGQLWDNGEAYLKGLSQKPNMIIKASVR